MNTGKFSYGVLMPVFLAWLVGCSSWLGNPKRPKTGPSQGTPTAYVQVKGTLPKTSLALATLPIKITDTAGGSVGTIVLSDARFVLKDIFLKVDSTAETAGGRFTGPYVADLLTNRLTPKARAVDVQPGVYKSIELELTRLSEEDAGVRSPSDPLLGKSLYIAGQFIANGRPSKPFKMALLLADNFKVGLPKTQGGGLQVADGSPVPIVIDFAMGDWFRQIGDDLNKITTPEIVLDDASQDSAAAVRDKIKQNIETIADFRRDPNEAARAVASIKLSGAETDDQLKALARISVEQAKAAAVIQIPGSTVTGAGLDDEDGYLVYGVGVSKNGQDSNVKIDAGTGRVLYVETAQDEVDNNSKP